MTDIDAVRSIVSTYEKYGWVLRRFLTGTDPAGEIAEQFPGIPAKKAGIDAAWFSRPPQAGEISWELRFLGEPAFALLQHADENDPSFEDTLTAVEQRLMDAVAAKRQGLTSG